MKTLDQQLEAIQDELSQQREHHITEDNFTLWKNNDITKLFFMELGEQYLEALIKEPVVIASLQRMGEDSYLAHTDPVSETAINSAIKAGRVQVFEALLEYVPSNLEREIVEDD